MDIKWRSPLFGLFIIFALFFFYLMPGLWTYFLIPLILMVVILLIGQKKKVVLSFPLLMLTGVVVTGLFSGWYNRLFAFQEFWQDLLLFCSGILLLFFLQNISLNDNRRFFLVTRWVFWITGVCFAIHGFYQYFFWFPNVAQELNELEELFDPLVAHHIRHAIRNRRIFSIFGDPNMLALYLVTGTLWSLRVPFRRFILINIFLIPALCLTYSRTGWIAFLLLPLAYIVLASFHNKKEYIKPLGLRFLILLLIFSGVLAVERGYRTTFQDPAANYFEPVNERVLPDESLDMSEREFSPAQMDTARQRLGYWQNAFLQFSRSPWLGNGPGSFQMHYLFYKSLTVQETRYAHNIIFQALAEKGVFGAIFLCLFLFFPLLYFARYPDFSRPAMFFGWGAFAIFNLLSYYFYHELFFFLFVLVLGVTWPSRSFFYLNLSTLKRVLLVLGFLMLLLVTFLTSLSHYRKAAIEMNVQAQNATAVARELRKCNRLPIKERTTLAAIQYAAIPRQRKIEFLHENKTYLEYFPYASFLLSLYYYQEEEYVPALKYAIKAHIQYPYKAQYINHIMDIYRAIDNEDKVAYWEKRYEIAQHNFQ